MITFDGLVEQIQAKRRDVPASESVLVALSGIDASGKGYIAGRLVEALNRAGLHTVGIGIDGWLNLPPVRFSREDPGGHFYRHGIRLDEMFAQLIVPLKRDRSIDLEADLTEETATAYHRHRYQFQSVDVIVLEGVFLFKRSLLALYDLSVWIDSSFETALERALKRGQEGLPADETIQAFETIYFPAQRVHFADEDPRAVADFVLNNDDHPDRRMAASSD